jgi:peptide-methionine (S)-S-oxide reductase
MITSNNNRNLILFALVAIVMSTVSCRADKSETYSKGKKMAFNNEATSEIATFGAGCFWCVEAVFDELQGVNSVKSGYMGGKTIDPTYKEVCTGQTGHAEVAQIEYNPSEISYEELLEVFWSVHDPTTLNRQGADVGTQYRSVVFYHNDKQKELAEHYKNRLEVEGVWDKPIVTEISPAEEFYVAEDYHQNYFENNPEQSYCSFVVAPKVDKFRKAFKDKLKKD